MPEVGSVVAVGSMDLVVFVCKYRLVVVVELVDNKGLVVAGCRCS
jgi:hypothetical protein